MHLGKRQDLSLEQAVSLLGQTEAASRALELSQEYEASLHSRTFPRVSRLLLPDCVFMANAGCKPEVFPHFRV